HHFLDFRGAFTRLSASRIIIAEETPESNYHGCGNFSPEAKLRQIFT
ncbi:unnamed protein product, partial [Allacma fusca]